MTDEELKKKCTERAKIFQQAMESCHSSSPIDCIEWFADRIADLEKRNANVKEVLEGYKKIAKWCDKCELEKKISILLSCKNCPENKGGLICAKEYENKCLAQKIEFIKELQKENAELKEKCNSLQDLVTYYQTNFCKE